MIRRKLASAHPKTFAPYLVSTLNSLAILHSKTGCLSDAEMECGEALTISRKLAAADPGTHEAKNAQTLYNLGMLYKVNGRRQEALRLAREALETYGRCEARNPGHFEKDLEEARALVKNLEEKV